MKSFRVCLAALLLLLTPASQAEEGKVVLEEAFSGELSKEWFWGLGTWTANDGVLRGFESGERRHGPVKMRKLPLRDAVIECEFRFERGATFAGIIFNGAQERGHLVHLVMGKDQIRVLAHPKKGETVELVKQEGSLATDAWHRVKMTFSGETLKATIDDREITASHACIAEEKLTFGLGGDSGGPKGEAAGALEFRALRITEGLQPSPSPEPAKPAPTKLPENLVASLETHPDLTYARYGEREVKLDLYRPKERKDPVPAIVCIHGGGWFKGERSSMTNLAMALAARGFVTVSISYRLSGEAKFPAAIEDVKAAVRWLRANAATYGIDPANIGVTGLSAGGHLAALLATSGGLAALEGEGGHAEQSSAVQACIAMGAQSDLLSARIGELSAKADDPFYRTFLGGPQSEIRETYAMASPRHHLDESDPPLLFMSGANDDPSTHADETRADLEKLGIPTGLVLIKDAPHSFLGRQDAFDACLTASGEFFAKHFGR
jgi:acetyl esterase/lipase